MNKIIFISFGKLSKLLSISPLSTRRSRAVPQSNIYIKKALMRQKNNRGKHFNKEFALMKETNGT
jgi:hypothetical protein